MKPRRNFPLVATVVALLLVIVFVLLRRTEIISVSPQISQQVDNKSVSSTSPAAEKMMHQTLLSKPEFGAPAPAAPMEKIAARMSTRSDDLQVVKHADGRESMDLRGRFMHLSAKVTRADGTSAVQCFSSSEALEATVSK